METEPAQPTTTDDARTRIGIVACLISILSLAVATIPLFILLGSTDFASDFENGTSTADYSGMSIAGGLAITGMVSAAIGAAVGRGGARATCVFIVGMPVMFAIGPMVNSAVS